MHCLHSILFRGDGTAKCGPGGRDGWVKGVINYDNKGNSGKTYR